MHELVEVVLVPPAQVDEGLDGLVGVGGDVLALAGFEDAEHVVGEGGEVGDGGVNVGGFVDAHEGLVEDGEEIAEKVQGHGFFDDGEHHCFVALTSVHFEEGFEIGEEGGGGFHCVVGLIEKGVNQMHERWALEEGRADIRFLWH